MLLTTMPDDEASIPPNITHIAKGSTSLQTAVGPAFSDSSSITRSSNPFHCSFAGHQYQDRSPWMSTASSGKKSLDEQGREPILFPVKLHSLLEQVEADGVADVISWQPHGRSFVIRKPNEFKALLPTYLPGINKIKSFQRQVSYSSSSFCVMIDCCGRALTQLRTPVFPSQSCTCTDSNGLRVGWMPIHTITNSF
jgi:HSF-type DNA-binding